VHECYYEIILMCIRAKISNALLYGCDGMPHPLMRPQVCESNTLPAIHQYIRSVPVCAKSPRALACDKDSNVYVVDERAHCVKKYDDCFSLLWEFGKQGSGDGQLYYPTDVTVDKENNIFVTDRWNHRVQKISSDGIFITAFGRYGEADGELYEPWGIHCAEDGAILVADRGNARIVMYDTNGNFIRNIGSQGTSAEFYSSEQFKGNFHFTRWLRELSRSNTIETRFYHAQYPVGSLEYPEEIITRSNGDIYVVDRVGGHVALFNAEFQLKDIISSPLGAKIFEPSTLTFKDDLLFIGEESSGNVYIMDEKDIRVVTLPQDKVKVSNICFSAALNRLFVCDAWNGNVFSIDSAPLSDTF